MRRILIITAIVQCLCALWAQAVTLPFERNSEPFYAPKAKVEWAATNQLPKQLRIFKVSSANFSSTAISNLSLMGGSADAKRGSMYLYKTIDYRTPLKKVPDEARAYELGTAILAKLEIPSGDMMPSGSKLRAWYYPGTRSHMDKARRTMTTEPCTMGIEFRRMLDGIICGGQQVHLRFETDETLAQLEVSWYGLRPVQDCQTATVNQMVSWIKEGRARVGSLETTGTRWVKVADITAISIKDVTLRYDAFADSETEKLPDNLYPYAVIQAEAVLSANDKEIIWLCCPVVKEALNRPLRKDGAFGVYPSTLYAKQRQSEGGP